MPTYEYACKECGEHLEVVQSFKDDPLTTCPNCGGELRKVFGTIGISFKGDGFYRNDSRASSRRAATASGQSSSATATGESAGSKEGSSSGAGTSSGSDKSSGSSGGSDSAKAAS